MCDINHMTQQSMKVLFLLQVLHRSFFMDQALVNWSDVRMILLTQFDHLKESYFHSEVKFKTFCPPTKINYLPTENVNETPDCTAALQFARVYIYVSIQYYWVETSVRVKCLLYSWSVQCYPFTDGHISHLKCLSTCVISFVVISIVCSSSTLSSRVGRLRWRSWRVDSSCTRKNKIDRIKISSDLQQ